MAGWYRSLSCTTLPSDGVFARRPGRPFDKICVPVVTGWKDCVSRLCQLMRKDGMKSMVLVL